MIIFWISLVVVAMAVLIWLGSKTAKEQNRWR